MLQLSPGFLTREPYLAQWQQLHDQTFCRGASTLPDATKVVCRAHCGTATRKYRLWAGLTEPRVIKQEKHLHRKSAVPTGMISNMGVVGLLTGHYHLGFYGVQKIPKPATVRNTTFFVKLYHKEHIFRC